MDYTDSGSQPKRFTESQNCEFPWVVFAVSLVSQENDMHHSNIPQKFIIVLIKLSMTMNLSVILVISISSWARFSTTLMIYRDSQATFFIHVVIKPAQSRKYWNGPPFLIWTHSAVSQSIGETWQEFNFVNTGAPTKKIIVFNKIKFLQYEKHQLLSISAEMLTAW